MTLAELIPAARAYLDPGAVDCIIYHHPCNDGTGAALAAWYARGDEIDYIPLDYTKPFFEQQLRNKNVVMIDVAFKREQLENLRAIAHKIMVLDHHDSAMQELQGVPGCFFTMQHSGAVLGWHYFHGLDFPPPRLLQLIEDRDLWLWNERAASEPLYYALADRHQVPDFRSYAPYLDLTVLDALLIHGQELVAKNRAWCVNTATQAELQLLGIGEIPTRLYKAMCIELKSNKLISELAEYLYLTHDVDLVMLWFPLADGKYKLSFRTNKPDLNVGDLARQLGGGGHVRAAGATLSYSPRQLLQPTSAE